MEMRGTKHRGKRKKKTDNDIIDKSKNIDYCIKHKWFIHQVKCQIGFKKKGKII